MLNYIFLKISILIILCLIFFSFEILGGSFITESIFFIFSISRYSYSDTPSTPPKTILSVILSILYDFPNSFSLFKSSSIGASLSPIFN